jgi:hypothetical protein
MLPRTHQLSSSCPPLETLLSLAPLGATTIRYRMRWRRSARVASVLPLAVAISACGARTTLAFDEPEPDGGAPPDAEAGVEAPDAPCSTEGVVTLANLPMNGGDVPEVVALDDTNVYFWIDPDGDAGGSILSVPKCGGSVVTLAAGQPFPAGLAADGTSVYWTNASTEGTGSVMSVPRGGGALVTVAHASDPIALAVDDTDAYWTDPIQDTVMRVKKSGGVPITLASRQEGANSVAVDDTRVYWNVGYVEGCGSGSGGSIVSVDKGGGVPVTIAKIASFPGGIAVDAANVYWSEADATGATSLIVRAPLAGGAPFTLASTIPNIGQLAVDDENLYFTDDGGGESGAGTVLYVPKLRGGTPATIATGQSGPAGLAVDATSVYWANDLVQVLKAPK